VGDDQMPFSFDELLNWARSLVMVIDHRIKTPETMEVLKSCRKCSFLSSKEIKQLKRKLEMPTESSDDEIPQGKRKEKEDVRKMTGRRRKRKKEEGGSVLQ